jgi:hypothetical protein
MTKTIEGIDWTQPRIVETATGAKGVITSEIGTEDKPCFTCSDWDKDNRKLMQFLTARGLKADENGVFETPIVQDFHDGRRSMKIDLRDWGYCQTLGMPTHMLAGMQCLHWRRVMLIRDLKGKI